MNLSPRDRLILVAGVAFVACAALVAVAVLPQIGRLGDLGRQITTAEQESSAAKTLLEQRQQVKNKASITDATLIQLANAVPENPELPSLIIELQDIASDRDPEILLRSVTPGEPEQAQGTSYVAVPVDIEFLGTWRESVNYLQDLRRLTRQIRIVQFETEVLEDGQAVEADLALPPFYQVSTKARLEIYVIPPGETTSTVPAPATTP